MTIRFIVVMGVSGCGKTEVGNLLAEHFGWDFFDADDFHPPENVSKMARGIPLTDSDRSPWLVSLHHLISSHLAKNHHGVLACSALKERYRQQLLEGNEAVQLIYLKGSYELIWSRMIARKDHFMKPQMLQSQLETLEEPANALTVDIAPAVEEVIKVILQSMEK